MALYGMPFLVLNYGAEMMFVLQTRFIAQKVSEKASCTVINEFSQLFFSSSFMDEVFRPQVMYSYTSTKELFTSLAQSTIMRLSDASLSKLFDLMTMGLKYQLFTLRHPIELVEMTFYHMEELRNILTLEARGRIFPVFGRLQHLVSQLLPGDLAEIRRQMLNLFLVRNVSVSVLVESNRQLSDGSFIIPRDSSLSPCANYEAPGTIRYYDEGTVVKETKFTHRDSDLQFPSSIVPGTWNPTNPAVRLTMNNVNLYTLRPHSLASPGHELAQPGMSLDRDTTTLTTKHSCGLPSGPKDTSRAVTGELNFLSKFVGCDRGEQQSRQPQQQSLTLNIFGNVGDCEDEAEPVPRATNVKNDSAAPNSRDAVAHHMDHMGRNERETQNRELLSIVGEMRVGNSTSNNPAGTDDLLDIMDED